MSTPSVHLEAAIEAQTFERVAADDGGAVDLRHRAEVGAAGQVGDFVRGGGEGPGDAVADHGVDLLEDRAGRFAQGGIGIADALAQDDLHISRDGRAEEGVANAALNLGLEERGVEFGEGIAVRARGIEGENVGRDERFRLRRHGPERGAR